MLGGPVKTQTFNSTFGIKRDFIVRLLSLTFLLLSVSLFCRSQICTGSLGDPVVNINFGAGNNPGGPLAASTTNYTYTSATCPADGSYTVNSTSPGCFSSTWHALSDDHTPGDNGGQMMVVNASITPGDFYVGTVTDLCENSTYEFSAWILNILKTTACSGNGIQPNLTFNIETISGTNLGKYETGSIPQTGNPQWKQFGLFFKTPSNVNSVVVRITNNAPGGCGNDLVLDDISFRPCGPTVTASAVLASGGTSTVDICDTDLSAYKLEGIVSSGYSNPAYQWQQKINDSTWTDITGATSTSYIRSASSKGIYYYRLTLAERGNIGKANCRVVSNTITMKVNEKPLINASSNSPVCEGNTVQFQSSAFASVRWTGPNGYAATGNGQVIATPAVAGKYYVQAVSGAGCTNIDSTVVIVNSNPQARVSRDQIICEGASGALTAAGGSSYLWTPATGLSASNTSNPTASPLQTTRYHVKVSNAQGCYDTASVLVQVNSKPVANAGTDKKISEGERTTLNGTVKGTEVRFYWAPTLAMTNDSSLTPSVSPASDISYTLHAVSGVGCGTATDNVFVRVFKKVIVPNVFSPNGDGINDNWQIQALETYGNAIITVFNRYGQQVFQSRGYSRPWNGMHMGKPLPTATYYYVIELDENFPTLSGSITILR